MIKHYNNLYEDAIKKIKSDDYEVDNLIDSALDDRYGMTFLTRPAMQVKEKIQILLNELKTIEPNQYYYSNSDIHITVMSIISCYSGFELEDVSIREYVELIEKSLDGAKSFEAEFRGITLSPSCVMIQGFVNNDTLNVIRGNLRFNFRNSDLQQSLDRRYPLQTAHSTVVRLRERLTRKQEYLDILEKYRNFHFGKFKIDTFELVYNDWYQREKSVKRLHQFNLK